MNNNTNKLEEILIEKWDGSISILANALGQSTASITMAIKRGIKKRNTQRRYTNALNRAFGESFSAEEIFDK